MYNVFIYIYNIYILYMYVYIYIYIYIYISGFPTGIKNMGGGLENLMGLSQYMAGGWGEGT